MCRQFTHKHTIPREHAHECITYITHARTHAHTHTHLLIKDKVHSICVGREYVVLERDWSPICVHHMARLWQVHMWAYAVVRER